MFGGLQASGAVRLRTNDVFLLDLAAGAPCWQYISGSTLPSGSNVAGQVRVRPPSSSNRAGNRNIYTAG
jgi:hypothetical protein